MRNLLGRLHARRMPDLLRIAEAWGVPLSGESKGDVVGALYRAMTGPGAVRDLWDRLDGDERAMAAAMADAPDAAEPPTVAEIAATVGVAEDAARETALRLYRMGVLAREGDDDPLPHGELPRLILPREIALHVRRLQDEMAAGDLTQAPLRVLLELLDDAELETAARTWGLRVVPGTTGRTEVAARLLRLVNDRDRVDRVVRARSRDAAAIWKTVRAADQPVPLADAAARSGLGQPDAAPGTRLRAALAELEGALLVWHAYRRDRTRLLFVPAEIRSPGDGAATELPPLVAAEVASDEGGRGRHPDAAAWDLLTLVRVAADRQAPAWEAGEPPPRWLARTVNPLLWFRGANAPPTGYLETLCALALAEGVLTVDEDARPPRVVPGPRLRDWRSGSFREQTARLRERWLRLPRWVEGEPAGLVEVWGADWRGMRPRLLAALADTEIGLTVGEWATLESLASRVAGRYPRLLGPSFSAATARVGGEGEADGAEQQSRHAALTDVIAVELAGAFAWFGIVETGDGTGRAQAVRLTELGAAWAARKEPPAPDAPGEAQAPIVVAETGEVALHLPSPARVWALAAFAEQVDLGSVSHFRLTRGSVTAALAAGIERDQIVAFLERASGRPLPPNLAAELERWAPEQRRVRMGRAIVLGVDDPAERTPLLHILAEDGWDAEPLADRSVLVRLSARHGAADAEEARLIDALRAATLAPLWRQESTSETGSVSPPGSG